VLIWKRGKEVERDRKKRVGRGGKGWEGEHLPP